MIGGGGGLTVPRTAGAAFSELISAAPVDSLRAAALPAWSAWEWVSMIARTSAGNRPIDLSAVSIFPSFLGRPVSMITTPSSPSTRNALTYPIETWWTPLAIWFIGRKVARACRRMFGRLRPDDESSRVDTGR